MSKKLTQERLKESLQYNLKTGIFTRKVSICSAKKGDLAGSVMHGYLQTRVAGTAYLNHRLAWLYIYGYFPENNIDHINRNKKDNRIENLREVSHTCNLRNTGNPKNNTSGVKGVCRYKTTNKWKAFIKTDGEEKYLGVYENFCNAVCARLAGEQCLNWEGCDDNSPAYQYVQNNIIKIKENKT